jgi:MFS family permease
VSRSSPNRLRFAPIPRAPGVTNRVVGVGLAARFFDELLSGLPQTLMPTIQVSFGLSLTQVGMLDQLLFYVAALVEPGFALLIDVWKRHLLMAFGAAGIGGALVLMGLAPGYAMLLAGYALFGLTSGPLAHTADVVLVEAHPAAPSRIFARSTAVDSIGAMLAPLLVTLAFAIDLDWRLLLVGVGMLSLAYALVILRTAFPPAAKSPEDRVEDETRDGSDSPVARASLSRPRRAMAAFRKNLRSVLADPLARRWLVFLLLLEVLEAPSHFVTVWLGGDMGFDQGQVGSYRALEMAVAFVALISLDRLLTRVGARRLLVAASMLLLLLYPAWLFLAPGSQAVRFLIGMPIAFLSALFWPIGRSRALASVPGRAGALTAITALFGFLPLSLGLGWAADRLAQMSGSGGLAPTGQSLSWVMMGVFVLGAGGMVWILVRMPEVREAEG